MFGKKEKVESEGLADKFNQILEKIQNDRDLYDEETKKQLEEIKNSDWGTNRYLREILWELRYARRKANRP